MENTSAASTLVQLPYKQYLGHIFFQEAQISYNHKKIMSVHTKNKNIHL